MDGEQFDVVVVDNAPEVREVVARALRLSGRFVVVAEGESGRDAIELVTAHQPAVLLLDASMPELDGLDAIPAVRRASPRTRVVMLSGFDAPGLAARALELGADASVERSKLVHELPATLLTIVAPGAAAEAGVGREVGDADVLAEHVERFRTVFDQAATAQVEDLTGRRAVLEALRASEERFRLMVEHVVDYAIFMLDVDGRVATWNLGAERMKGYRADEIIGRHFRTFYPGEARLSRHPEHELELAVRDGRYGEEGWRVRKDGSMFWANVVITALFDADRRLIGFAKVTRDMTERRRAQQERDKAAAELEATAVELASANERLRAAAERVDEFLAVTAHELQSPVSAITGAADILAEYWDRLEADERAETLGHITRGGVRIRRLLSDLLTASRLEGTFELRHEDVDVESAIKEALTEATLGAGYVDVSGALPALVRADRTRVVQMLTNLLTNAVKYGRPPVVIEVRRAGDDVEIRVRDGGAGVPDALLPRLFGKFVRGGVGGSGGTGLGLFIVRELARLQGGDAWYERAGGPGACFAVRLPSAG